MATAMADGNVTETAAAIGNGNCNGNGQQRWQWAMATGTAMEWVMVTETGTAIAMVTAMVRATMLKGGLPLYVLAMCSAVAGATPCLHPHRHKGVCIHQRCIMGVMLQRVFAPFQGGGFLTAHHGLFIYFLQLLFSLLNNPLFVPCFIQALKNLVSPLTLYFLHSYFIFLQW
jgi:hypothetical protein